jgi:hypothetical protein
MPAATQGYKECERRNGKGCAGRPLSPVKGRDPSSTARGFYGADKTNSWKGKAFFPIGRGLQRHVTGVQDSAEEVEKRNDHYVLGAKCVAILLPEFAKGTRAELRAVALRPDRRKRHVREAKKTKACFLQATDNDAGRAGQAWAGKSLENVDKSLIFRCNPRKLCEEWNL